MTGIPSDGMYWDFHWPMPLKGLIDQVLGHHSSSPNTPDTVTNPVDRHWLSQPRPGSTGGPAPKVNFFYCTGTSYIAEIFGSKVGPVGGGQRIWVPGTATSPGGGKYWNGLPANDPFPWLLNPSLYQAYKIDYPAAALFMGDSMDHGKANVIAAIEASNGPFCLGGYSQGAAVMSLVYQEIVSGSLQHRRKDFLGGVTFGNPMREVNHTWPGSTWSGSWDVASSTTGGHGCFPSRLSGTEDLWWDFTNVDDIISATGDSTEGLGWSAAAGIFSGDLSFPTLLHFLEHVLDDLAGDLIGLLGLPLLLLAEPLPNLLNPSKVMAYLMRQLARVARYIPVAGDIFNSLNTPINVIGSNGHILYPTDPPPGDPENGLTSYQIALNYLNGLASKWQSRYDFTNQTEVVSINFKLPLSLSEISFEALRVPHNIELWYQDRLNNWRQVLDRNRIPVTVTVQYSSAQSWYKHHVSLYPIVAKALQFRCTRVPDAQVGSTPYVLGLRNILPRRNVYDRAAGVLPFEDEQDPIGNVISKYIKDWDASRAVDDRPLTYWKSSPLPDPQGVANLYLDTRSPDGSPQMLDGITIDPLYTGQVLNLYYSNDETVGTRRLSSITQIPQTAPVTTSGTASSGTITTLVDNTKSWTTNQWAGYTLTLTGGAGAGEVLQIVSSTATTLTFASCPIAPNNTTTYEVSLPNELNVEWRADKGRWDISSAPSGHSRYVVPLTVGHLVNQDAWIGMEWWPDFDPLSGPANNPILFQTTPTSPDPDQYWPVIKYDVGAGEIRLELHSTGHATKTYSVALSPVLVQEEPLRIVVGWRYSPDVVYLSVRNRHGVEIGHLENTSPALPSLLTLDGTLGFCDFRGRFTSHLIKLESYTAGGAAAYQANPAVYITPDPVIPNTAGQVPSTTLDNAVYAADWTIQEHGTGGHHDSFYEDKSWTPIWRDYLTYRGKLFFPSTISMRYLKLEFTNLTEEPYPVYDAGVQTTYKIFPIQVQQLAKVKHPGLLGTALGMLELGADLALGAVGIGSVNWLHPSTVSAAVDRIFGTTVYPVTVTTGVPVSFTTTMPASTTSTAIDVNRTESANPYVYKRDPASAEILAGETLKGLGSQWIQTIGYSSSVVAGAISDSFTPLTNFIKNPTALPVQGKDWWLFPGGAWALPAAIMNGLTALTQVVLGRKPTTETRIRFMTTSVHRYDVKTITRDAAIAYFAGVREVKGISTSYVDYQDPPAFEFSAYNPDYWAFSVNAKQLDTGPVTTKGKVYEIENPAFDTSLTQWEHDPAQGWARDGRRGRWHWGSAHAVADGTTKEMRSTSLDVTPGDQITISCWALWEDLVAPSSSPAVALGATTYTNGTKVADVVVDDGSVNPWNYISGDAEGGTYAAPGAGGLDGGLYTDLAVPDEPTWVRLVGTLTVPSNIDQIRVLLRVNSEASAGRIWFDTVNVLSADEVMATVYNQFRTTSNFSKVKCNFRDSGLVRSNAMWSRDDPLATNIENLKLAYYVSFIGSDIPAGTWSDTFRNWSDHDITWGAPRSLLSISIDPDRIFDGRRVLKFHRQSGAGESGLKIQQHTNYVAGALVRIGTVFYKPLRNDNDIILRLIRVSDGSLIHEETIPKPPKGYDGRWYTFQGQFFEVPTGEDQVYSVELTTVGAAEDELYVNDLYTEVAQIRYTMQLGAGSPLDVTPLRYVNSAQVTATVPVSEVSVQATILSPKAYAYSCDVMPLYLK
jgi:hypothetical protein